MIRLSLRDAAAFCGATLDGDGDLTVESVTTDTRRMVPGSLFVALRGTRHGHQFLPEAAAGGAVAAIVEHGAEAPSGLALLRTDDSLAALGRLAARVRERLKARVVAITGSVGKTSTKDFTAAVVSPSFATVASQASFNNEIGVPLTILSATEQTEVAVVEVGSRGIGHIAALAPIVRPDISVVTSVGLAHAEMFGSLEAVAIAKGELVEALDRDGCAVLNADDPAVSAMAARAPGDVLRFGTRQEADVAAEDVSVDEHARARFTLVTPAGRTEVALPVSGEHMVHNALAAAAAGYRLQIDPSQIAGRLSAVAPSPHRMQVVQAPGGWRIIDDAYNASPASMAAALRTLVTMGRGRRTWAVLGHMAELGSIATEEHDRVGRLAVRLGVGRLVVVGAGARAMYEAARLEGVPPDDLAFVADAVEAADLVRSQITAGDVVLVKASRVAGLEAVAEALAE